MDASCGALTHCGAWWEPAQAGMQGTLPVPADRPRGPRLGAGADLPSHPDLCPSEALGPRTCQMGDVPTILAAPPPQDGEWTLVISDGGTQSSGWCHHVSVVSWQLMFLGKQYALMQNISIC